jgi:hypothetical protein
MIRYISIAVLTISAIHHVSAQQGRNLDDHVLIKMSQQSIYQAASEKYEGSPYRQEEFIEGVIYINEGNYGELPLRYNIFKDYVEFKKGTQTFVLDANLKINEVIIGSDTLIVAKYLTGGKERLGFFNLLVSGKTSLLAKHIVKYREAQPPKALETDGKLAKYSEYPDIYFVKFDKGELVEVDNIKKLIQKFPDRQDELNAFVKENKISKNEEDMRKLISYYNLLQ